MRLVAIIPAMMLICALAIPAFATVSTTTVLHFNVATVEAFTNTLYGESSVTATGGGAATSEIEFNSSTGTNSCVEAKVVAGSTQDSTHPIMSLDNTGTVNLNLSISLNTTVPSCMTLIGKTTYACAEGTTITNSPTTIVNDFTPSAPAQDWFMWANFTACTSSDSTTRTATISGITS